MEYLDVIGYNINAQFSTEIFGRLLEQDLRIFVAPNAWEILCRDYRENVQFYAEKLIQACNSEMKDLSETAAGFACALAVFFSDAFLLDYIMNNRHTDDMVNRISIQAAATFGREEYREVSSQILLHMSKEYDIELSAFRSEFFKKNIIIQRDADFLRQVLESRSGTKIAYSFLKYLSESDQDITCFADTIKAVGAQIPQKPDDYRERMIVEDLIQCVIQLFDRGKNDSKIIPMQKQNSSASGQQKPAEYMATNTDRFPFAKERGCVRMATSFSKQKLPNDR